MNDLDADVCVTVHFIQHQWTAEPWSLGGMVAMFWPGVLTTYGSAIREPVGRIHWAGTETATRSHGMIDGAMRSGQRAAGEVMADARGTSATLTDLRL